MPAPIVSKEEVLRRLTEAFRRVGYDGATLALLARETGLQKASLYHYFPGGKIEMAEAALGQVAKFLELEIFDVLRAKSEPHERLRTMTGNICRFYGSGRKWCLVDLFSLGEAGEKFQESLKAALETWRELLSSLAQETGVPAEVAEKRGWDVLIAIEGSLVLARATDQPQLFAQALDDIPRKLLGP